MKKISIFQIFILIATLFLGIFPLKVSATNEIATEIIYSDVGDSVNQFTYSGTGLGGSHWVSGIAGSHTWTSAAINPNNADEFWYEVKFFGHKIEIFAEKNHPLGLIKYQIDDGPWVEKDLYSRNRVLNAKIHTFENLTEGVHTLKAVAKGVKSPSNSNASKTAISAGKVIVYKNTTNATSIRFNEESYTLDVNESLPFTILIEPDTASLDDLVYTIQNPDILAIENNRIIGKMQGSSNISVTSRSRSDLNATARVVVNSQKPFLGGSIVSLDKQYTNEKLDEVKNLNLTSTTLSGWKNDKLLSLIALYTKASSVENINISFTDLQNENGDFISASSIKGHFIKSTKAYVGPFLGYGSQTRPVPRATEENRKDSSDILYQEGRIDSIAANQVQPVLLSFEIPKTANAGTYITRVVLSGDNIEPLTFNYSVKVFDIALHDTDQYKNYFDLELWQYPYRSAEYYNVEPFSLEHFAILKPMLDLYKSVGGDAITTTLSEDAWSGQTYSSNPKNGIHYPSMIKWVKQNNQITYDYTDFDKWVGFAKANGLGQKVVVYSMAPWHQSFTYWENGNLVKEAFNSTNYIPMWRDFLQNFVAHLDEKGWTDSVYIGFDERHFDSRAFNLVNEVKASNGKSLKTTGAMDRFDNKMQIAREITDLTIGDYAAVDRQELFNQLVLERDAKGLKTTLYSCTEHQPGNFSLSAPVESYWSVINAGKQTTGFLRWAYDAWVENPLEDATHNAFEPGDPFIVYPGDQTNGNKVRSSIRLERLAEGVRDMNKIKLMLETAPSLKQDVDAMFRKIRTVATKNRDNYMSSQQIDQLSLEMQTFKDDLNRLTEKYLELLASSTKEISSIEVNDKTVAVGDVFTLDSVVLPENVINKDLRFISGDEKLLTVNHLGQFTALKKGLVVVRAISKLDPTKETTATVNILRPTVSTQGQIAYYSFDLENGNDSWNQRHANAIGEINYVESDYGKAAFLSANSHFSLPNNDILTFDSDWTVSYHFKVNEMPSGRTLIMSNRDMSHGTALRLDASNNRNHPGYRVGTRNGDVLTYRTNFQPNTWYHVVWTQNRQQGLSMYVNGELIETNNWSAQARNIVNAPIEWIGNGFEGFIDEVKIYNRALSTSEVKNLDPILGLNIKETEKTLDLNESYAIDVELNADQEYSIVYSSNNNDVASVDANGNITAKKRGQAIIKVVAGPYKKEIVINVVKIQNLHPSIPRYVLPEEHLKTIDSRPNETETTGRYLGQPDMIQTETGRLIMAYPKGHGKGPVIMQISDDEGENWRELTNTPSSWAGSQETPTLYKLSLENGKQRLIMINSNPGWGVDSNNNRYGFNTSYSDDNGETWSEYRNWHPQLANNQNNDAIVAMASLVQLKDENGEFIQKWMGVYHTGNFINYRTYLTFDSQGQEQWSTPEPYLSNHRSIEASHQICEVGIFRSPDGKRLVALARSQSHQHLATLFYSDDEGLTWSKPEQLPASLAGERHKIAVDPISKRLMIVFREIKYDINQNNRMERNDWLAGEWLAWVGSYDQLMNLEEGDYNLEIAKDYAPTPKSGDTGYTGIVALKNGEFVMVSYGHFNEEESLKWINVPRGVYKDLVSIKQAKFKLGKIENLNGLVDKTLLLKQIENALNLDEDLYTKDSYANVKNALSFARSGSESIELQQIEIDTLTRNLKAMLDRLEFKPKVEVVLEVNNLSNTSVSKVILEKDNLVKQKQLPKTGSSNSMVSSIMLIASLYFAFKYNQYKK